VAVHTLTVPDLGEGLVEATVLDWLVAVGDRVERNDPLVEVETPKAAVELPSPVAGLVTALHAQPGDTLAVGSPLITLETAEQAGIVGTVPSEGQPTRRVRLTPPSS
jgi:pyruvate/2-oxoglutarate dehydrogenase complex dihydrolipoamide acyltransferase (E2) component